MKQIKTIFLKELKEAFRDKRTVLLSIVIPLILFPLVFYFMNFNNKSNKDRSKNYKIYLDESASYFENILKDDEKIIIIKELNSNNSVKNKELDLIVEKNKNTYTIRYDNTNTKSIFAMGYFESIIAAAHGNTQKIDYEIKKVSIYDDTIASGLIILSILLPTLLFLFSASAPMATASDISSGEKERLTLEPLLTNPVKKYKIIIGKISTITVIGTLGVISFLTGVFIAYKITPEFFSQGDIEFSILPISIAIIIIFGLTLVMINGTVELTIGIFSKSIKEAQVYYLPYILINSSIGYATMSINPHDFSIFYRFIPLFNIAILIKQLCMNIIEFKWIFFTFIQSCVYIIIIFYFLLYIFKNEKIIFRT